MLYYLGIAVMVVGLGGLIFCSKKQRVNPAMQPIAFIFAVVMLIGLGVVLYNKLGDGEARAAIENEKIFARSQYAATGSFIKKNFPGKKVMLLLAPKWDAEETQKNHVEGQIAALNEALGGQVVIATVELPADFDAEGSSVEDVLTVKMIKDVLAKNPGVNIIITTIGLPEKCDSLFSGKDAPQVFMISQGMIDEKTIKKLFKNGKLIGMIDSKSDVNYDIPADEDNLIASFDIRYSIIDGKNYTKKFK